MEQELSVLAKETAAEVVTESMVSTAWTTTKDTAIGLVEEYPLVAAGAAAVGVLSVAWWGIKKLRKKK